MGKTILFYNVGIYKNNELTNLNFIDFIDEISLTKWENRLRKIDNDVVAIFPIIYNDSHKEKRIIPTNIVLTSGEPIIRNRFIGNNHFMLANHYLQQWHLNKINWV